MKRNTSLENSFSFNFDYDEKSRAYLKKMALETVISFIARSISMSDFRIGKNGKRVYNDEHYKLNVRPNTDQSASDFWFHFVSTLLHEREVLVIPTDDGSLVIADSFMRTEYALYPDVFSDVIVKNYEFERTFRMDEVIYLQYGNEQLSKFMDGMFQDYTNLFNRLIEINLRSNQIRAVVGIDTNQALDSKRQAQLQKFIDDLFKSFREKTVAIVPKLKGFDYEEVADGSETSRTVDELTKLKKSLIDEVCDILGVPQSLIHGDIAEMDSLMKAYTKFCLGPINKLIEDELNAKLLSKNDYLKGDRIKVIGLQAINIIENAEAVDKLVSSGAYSRNEVRVKFGDEPSDNPALDEYVITKNYESVEGGEIDENKATV
jgi:HK97 family phage portal protein